MILGALIGLVIGELVVLAWLWLADVVSWLTWERRLRATVRQDTSSFRSYEDQWHFTYARYADAEQPEASRPTTTLTDPAEEAP